MCWRAYDCGVQARCREGYAVTRGQLRLRELKEWCTQAGEVTGGLWGWRRG